MKKVILLSSAIILVLTLNGCDNKKGLNVNTTPDPTPAGYSHKGGEVVNSFVLPPYPDPKINDSTLLGIDTNNNGVRDDVERWLIFRYKDHHPIVTEIGFQGARAHQIVIQDPSKAEETTKLTEAAQSCNFYFQYSADEFGEEILIDHDILTSTAYKTMQFNTKERIEAYLAYNKKLSGGVYSMPFPSEERAFCTFDIDKMLGK